MRMFHRFLIFGIQVLLYKGKYTNPLDPNNYRGITLLSCFNKLWEILVWGRMEKWWTEIEIVSNLKGACRKGSSCSTYTARNYCT